MAVNIPGSFENAYVEQEGQVEANEISAIINAAHYLITGEQKEKNLFYMELHLIEEMIDAINDATEAFKKNWTQFAKNAAEFRKEIAAFETAKRVAEYLRSHTISKISLLKRVYKEAKNISADAEVAMKYENQVRSLASKARKTKIYSPRMLRKSLARTNATRLSMIDLDRKAEDIRHIEAHFFEDTHNMLDILEGRASPDPVFGRTNFPATLRHISAFTIGPIMGKGRVAESLATQIASVLKRQLREADSFYGIIDSIETNDRKIRKLAMQIRRRAA